MSLRYRNLQPFVPQADRTKHLSGSHLLWFVNGRVGKLCWWIAKGREGLAYGRLGRPF